MRLRYEVLEAPPTDVSEPFLAQLRLQAFHRCFQLPKVGVQLVQPLWHDSCRQDAQLCRLSRRSCHADAMVS